MCTDLGLDLGLSLVCEVVSAGGPAVPMFPGDDKPCLLVDVGNDRRSVDVDCLTFATGLLGSLLQL